MTSPCNRLKCQHLCRFLHCITLLNELTTSTSQDASWHFDGLVISSAFSGFSKASVDRKLNRTRNRATKACLPPWNMLLFCLFRLLLLVFFDRVIPKLSNTTSKHLPHVFAWSAATHHISSKHRVCTVSYFSFSFSQIITATGFLERQKLRMSHSGIASAIFNR